LGSYGLEPTGFLGVASRHGVDIAAPVEDPAHNEELRTLLESGEFQDIIRLKSDAARELLRDYLVSIGFMGKRNIAVVDANSEGNTQSLLERAFRDHEDYPTVHGYYFNLLNLNTHDARSNAELPHAKGIITDWRTSPGSSQRALTLLGLLVELFSHPNHGLTVGYRRVADKVKPIFSSTPQESQYEQTSQGLHGMLSYARDYGTYNRLHNYDSDALLQGVKRNICKWVASPPKEDVEALKDLFVISDWPFEVKQSFIEQIEVKDIVTIREMLRKLASSAWPEGTLTLAPVPGLKWLFYKTGRITKLEEIT
ncbi:MAG: hypothetical protein V3S51_06670, partial [Dehalococcoidia bacterium]